MLSLEFGATGCVHEQLVIMQKIDSIRCVEESMKASRFVPQCSAAVRQGLVGAFVVVSQLSASQPVQAHGDVKGDAAMPDTSRAAGPQMTEYRSASCGAVRHGDLTSLQRDSALRTMSPRTWMP